MKKITIILACLSLLLIWSNNYVLAADADLPVTTPAEVTKNCDNCLNVPIGGVKTIPSFYEYIQLWYSFVVGVVGIIATVIIMWGGFKWLTSRGNAAAIGDAKDRIWSAIIGLVLVFLSYNLLYLINPELVKIKLPSLTTISTTNSPTHSSNNQPPTHPAEGAKFDLEALKKTCLDAITVTGAGLNCNRLNISGPVYEATLLGSSEMGYWYNINDNLLEGVQEIVNLIGQPQTIEGVDVYVMPGTNLAFREIDNNIWRVETTNLVGLMLEQDTNSQNIVAWPMDIWNNLHNIPN
ncbi:hypothetical protein GW933_02925 [Candidatus Falkowbacteria bacterium]|uniref:Uncharacterized protein n=1 Tax=Candidatus Buchananbacteria bacterium CG10_big_fil_rev_8_21_14_0_10_33_19 TaxID=1974525 RepID=A0A2H0W4I3_9BACT|nr:hypothetical protein [Candidatus Falkowbacteria bacterium]PIS06263.1 MAG: hypothetical protein COT80_01680 [Candidatus Buchananbacteria bacterium CG10_big_fil_rev_8_21_14_0_10_33_19]